MLDWDILQIRSASFVHPIDLLYGPIRLKGAWSPQIAPQRRSGMGGYDPQLDVLEELSVTIAAPTREQCALHLDDLTYLLQVQATDFAAGLPADPVVLDCRVRGSSLTTTYLILGQQEENQQVVMPPVEGMQQGKHETWFYPEVTIAFLRRGSPVLAAETNEPVNLLPNAEDADDGLPWTGVEYGGADANFGPDATMGLGTNGYAAQTVTLLVTGSQTRYAIHSGNIGEVASGEVFTFAMEAIVPALLTIPAVVYLQNIDTSAIISNQATIATTNTNDIFPVPPRSVYLTASAASTNTRVVIKLENVTVPMRTFSFAEPVLARGVTATWRESLAQSPEPQVVRFASSPRFPAFASIQIGPFTPLDFQSLPAFLILTAKSSRHINVIAAREMVAAPLATVVADSGRITYGASSEVLSLIASPTQSGRAPLNLDPHVRRVKVFVVGRATDLNGAYRVKATIFGSSDASYLLPLATTEPHDYIATDLNPHWFYVGEAALSDTSPKWIRIEAERLQDSDALYIDQVIVVAAEDETTGEITMRSIPNYNQLVGITNVNLIVRYDPQHDYRPMVGLQNTATGDTTSLHERGNASLVSVGDQMAVAIIGCTGANYVLTTDKTNAPIYLETSATRYQRISVPR